MPVSSRFFLAVALVVILPAALQAQYGNRQRQQQQQQFMQQQQVELQGRIRGVAKGNSLVVFGNDGVNWQVDRAPITKVRVSGTVNSSYLHAGLIVELTADVDSHGAIHDKVDTLTITSLSQEKQMGLFPSGDAKGDGVVDGFGADAEKDKDKPKGKSKDSAKTSGKSAKRTKTNPRLLAAGSYRIVGRLNVARNGFSVQADRHTLAFELAEQAKIEVDTSDVASFVTFVRPGNDVTVRGFQVPNRPAVLRAMEVRVKLPEPQPTDQPQSGARRELKKPAKAPKKKGKDKGEDEPPPEDGEK
jgi:hypothetical protein